MNQKRKKYITIRNKEMKQREREPRHETKRQNLSLNKEMKLILSQRPWSTGHLYIANQTSKCNHPIIILLNRNV